MDTEAKSEQPVAAKPKKPLWKRIVKGLLWFLGGTLLFVLVAFLTLPLWINPVATSVAKSLVPAYTGTAFNLERVELNPYTGKLLISGVDLANPGGYSEKAAFKLGRLAVDVEVTSLLSKTIHVREVTVDALFASWVFDAEGVNNIDRIIEAVNKKLGPKKEKEKEPSETKVVIDKVTVKNVAVAVGTGRFELASLTLTDFGKESPAKLEIAGVRLTNPPGFEVENAFSLGSLSIGMDTGDLGKPPFKIHDIVIDSPYASYVFDAKNVDNFTRMLEPLLAKDAEPKKVEKKAAAAKAEPASSGTPVTLDRLEVRNLAVQICRGRFELASFVVTDFGKPSAATVKLADAKLVNPEGFPEPNAFSLKSLGIGLETADLSKKPMVFHDIVIDTPYLGFSFDKEWSCNISAMFKPMGEGGKDGAEKKDGDKEDADGGEAKSEEDGARVSIDKFVLTNLKVGVGTAGTLPLGIPLPNLATPNISFTLSEIGKKSEKGASMKEVAADVKDKILEGLGTVGSLVSGIGDRIAQGKDGNMLDLFVSYAKNRGVEAFGSLKDKGGAVIGGLKDKGGAVIGDLKDKGGAVIGGLKGVLPGGDKKDDGQPGVTDKALEGAKSLGEGAKGAVEGVFKKVSNPFGN